MEFQLSDRDLAALVRAVDEADIAEFRLVTADVEIHISRDGAGASRPEGASPDTGGAHAASVVAPARANGHELEASPSTPAPEPPASGEDSGLVPVTSPMIGIFYVAPEPGADPFVLPGTAVTSETTIGLVEAMKLFTAVEARVSGTIERLLVANGEYVEYEQPLALVRPVGAGA